MSQGTRSHDGRIRPFKKGGFIMAINAGVPIVPIVMRGTRRIMSKGNLRIDPGNVQLQIKEPIDTSDYSRNSRNDLIKRVRHVICEGFGKD